MLVCTEMLALRPGRSQRHSEKALRANHEDTRDTSNLESIGKTKIGFRHFCATGYSAAVTVPWVGQPGKMTRAISSIAQTGVIGPIFRTRTVRAFCGTLTSA